MEDLNNTLVTKQNNIFWKIEYIKDADMLGFTGYYSRIDPWRIDKAKDYNLHATIQIDAKKIFDIFDAFLKAESDYEIEFPGSYGCMNSIKIINKKTKDITKITTRDKSIDEKDGQIFLLSYDHIMTTKILLSNPELLFWPLASQEKPPIPLQR